MAAAVVVALAAGAAAAVCVAERWRRTADTSVPEWTRLPNGLRFRVQRVKDARDVAVVTVFGTGTDSDPAGKEGLAHLAEHLYVTSAAGPAPARAVDERLDRYRNVCSATTYGTSTRMSVVVGPKRLEEELTEIAARMSELRIEQSDLDRERPRVLEQVAGARNVAMISARSMARARVHPTANSGIGVGVEDDVERLTLDDVRAFARRCYCPANARIVVAGDVEPDDVAARIERLFADLPGGEPAPELPLREPRFGTERIDRGERPGPGYEPCRAVCIAYALPRGTDDPGAAGVVLSIWRTPGSNSGDGFVVQTDEQRIEALWVGDERPIEEVVAAFDARVEDFAVRADGLAAVEQLRESRRAVRELARSMKDAGVPFPSADPPQSLAAASRLANPPLGIHDWDSVIAAVGPLTNADMRRFVASWHVAERRAVVDVRGWRRAAPSGADADADETKDETSPKELPPLVLVRGVRVMLSCDETTRTVHRKIGDREYAKDDELQRAIAEAHDAWAKKGLPDAPVTIDADPRIPWSEVTTVVNMIKRCGIDKIEFAMGAPPKAKQAK
jgi:hypothetical protein